MGRTASWQELLDCVLAAMVCCFVQSRYARLRESELHYSGFQRAKELTECTLVLPGTKARLPMKISLPYINYFYRGE